MGRGGLQPFQARRSVVGKDNDRVGSACPAARGMVLVEAVLSHLLPVPA